MPRFMLLLHESTTSSEDLGPDEIQAIIARYVAWSESMRARGKLLGGEKLKDGAPGRVLTRSGEDVAVRDGPYAETKEIVGGYFLIQRTTAQAPTLHGFTTVGTEGHVPAEAPAGAGPRSFQ